jgi:outer membrane protein OmpA-like peptidoglycan-associated protein
MANQPAHTTPENPSAVASAEDEKRFQELRQILLGEEQQGLMHVREHVENPKLRAQDVSAVVVEALRLRREQGGGAAIREELAPSVEEALRISVRRDPTSLADALFPVMGPAIRKSISETIRAMLEGFNEAMDRSLSWQGIKWRIESLRTGRSFAEVVLLRSLEYRVEQVFLIHRKTSLLLQHVVAPAVATQDPDMVSSMLSAIQDFVRDSFQAAQGQTLDTVQIGELQVWVEQGPHASLATVLRGHPPQSFHLTVKEKLENIHQRFDTEFLEFEGNAAPFAALREDLMPLLETRYKQAFRRRPRPYFTYLVLLLIVLLAGWKYLDLREDWRWDQFVSTLRHQQGIQVLSFSKAGNHYRIEGLRDPLSREPTALLEESGLDPNRAIFVWGPYYALDDALVLERATQVLRPPEKVVLGVFQGTLRVTGASPRGGWGAKLRGVAPLIPGLREVDMREFDDADTLDFQKRAVENVLIFFEHGAADIPADQQAKVVEAAKIISALTQKAEELRFDVTVEVVGHTDTTGADEANAQLSQLRAVEVIRALAAQGISARYFRPRGVGPSEPIRKERADEDRRFNRRVSFRVVAPSAAIGIH